MNEQLRVEHKKNPENENEDQREDEEWINEESVWPIKYFVFECLDQSIE
jgi:transcription initiation factor TFIID subunit TAF12